MAPRTVSLAGRSWQKSLSRSPACCAAFYATHIAAPAASINAPESPSFVDIPMPPQERANHVPEVKGILPVPRQVFPMKGPNKTSPEYLAAVTKEPRHQPGAWRSEITQWKARAADLRRKNLREGLMELHRRKEITDRRVGARSARRQALYEEAVRRPEREDERLTTPSLPHLMKSGFFLNVTDPERDIRIRDSKDRSKNHMADRKEEIRADLHSLYINARTFVVTERDLEDLIEDVFENDKWYQVNPDRGIWDKGFDRPDTVAELLTAQRHRPKAVAGPSKSDRLFADRATRIAEELTGGKLA